MIEWLDGESEEHPTPTPETLKERFSMKTPNKILFRTPKSVPRHKREKFLIGSYYEEPIDLVWFKITQYGYEKYRCCICDRVLGDGPDVMTSVDGLKERYDALGFYTRLFCPECKRKYENSRRLVKIYLKHSVMSGGGEPDDYLEPNYHWVE